MSVIQTYSNQTQNVLTGWCTYSVHCKSYHLSLLVIRTYWRRDRWGLQSAHRLDTAGAYLFILLRIDNTVRYCFTAVVRPPCSHLCLLPVQHNWCVFIAVAPLRVPCSCIPRSWYVYYVPGSLYVYSSIIPADGCLDLDSHQTNSRDTGDGSRLESYSNQAPIHQVSSMPTTVRSTGIPEH